MNLPEVIAAAESMGLGSACAGLLRLVPEGLKLLDRQLERNHELAMFDKQIALDAQQAKERLQVIDAERAPLTSEGLDALAHVAAAGRSRRSPRIDAFNALIRPLLTLYWCVVVYGAVLVWKVHALSAAGVPALTAVAQVWGAPEYAIVSGMITFWFMDRALRNGGGVGVAH